MGRIVAQNGGAGCLQARINVIGGIPAVSKCRAARLSWHRENTAAWPAQHKLNAEAEKLKAEARKFNVETDKIEKDLKYYFFTTLSIIAGIIATIYNIVKGLN